MQRTPCPTSCELGLIPVALQSVTQQSLQRSKCYQWPKYRVSQAIQQIPVQSYRIPLLKTQTGRRLARALTATTTAPSRGGSRFFIGEGLQPFVGEASWAKGRLFVPEGRLCWREGRRICLEGCLCGLKGRLFVSSGHISWREGAHITACDAKINPGLRYSANGDGNWCPCAPVSIFQND